MQPAADMKADKHMPVKYYSLCWHQSSGGSAFSMSFRWFGFLRVKEQPLGAVALFVKCENWNKKPPSQDVAGQPTGCTQACCRFWASFSSGWKTLPPHLSVSTSLQRHHNVLYTSPRDTQTNPIPLKAPQCNIFPCKENGGHRSTTYISCNISLVCLKLVSWNIPSAKVLKCCLKSSLD